MNTKKFTLNTLSLASILTLVACAQTPAPTFKTVDEYSKKAWTNIGVSPDGNVLNEIDQRSIRKQGERVVFRDRKTIFNMSRENFLSIPPHKQSINTWEIDCRARTYRLIDTVLYDQNQRLISSAQYKTGETRHLPIQKDSASEHQFNIVCHE